MAQNSVEAVAEPCQLHLVLTPMEQEQLTAASSALEVSGPGANVTEDINDAWHKAGVSTEFLHRLSCREQEVLTALPEHLPLPLIVRDAALRFMAQVIQQKNMHQGCWFEAAALFDAYCTKATGAQIEMLPLVCVNCVRLVQKFGSVVPEDARPNWLGFTKQFASWLTAAGYTVPQFTEDVLRRCEIQMLQAFSWKVQVPFLEQWSATYAIRFNILSNNSYNASLTWVHNQSMILGRLLIMRQASTTTFNHRDFALGLLCLGLIGARLLPLSTLRPAQMTEAVWASLYTASQPNGSVPTCAIATMHVEQILELLQAATNTELDDLKASAESVSRSLGNALAEIQVMQRDHRNAPVAHGHLFVRR